MIKNAFVNLWNKPVGAVAWNEETQTGNFEFDPNFLKTNLDLAPVKMSLAAAKGRIFSFPENKRSITFKAFPLGSYCLVHVPFWRAMRLSAHSRIGLVKYPPVNRAIL